MTTLLSMIRRGNFVAELTAQGYVYYSSDADQDDEVTGQTGFLNTTPTLMIDVPDGTTCVPLMMSLVQGGTVAGGIINVQVEIDKIDRYASVGTAEKMFNQKTGSTNTSFSIVYSGATANAGYGVRIFGSQVAQDVDPAEGVVNEVLWTPPFSAPPILTGPAAFLVYSYAATTGPTWIWSLMFASLPTTEAT